VDFHRADLGLVVDVGSNQSGNNRSDSSNRRPEEVNQQMTLQYLPWRGVTRDTMAAYGVYTEVAEDGTPTRIRYPYGNGRTKVRWLDQKNFYVDGQLNSETGYLFGRDRFGSGAAKAVTIVEGELDALSVYQMFGSQYPVVSVSGASSARSDVSQDYDWVNSYDKIYLCFDNDEPGKKAAQEVATLFDFNKVYYVKLDLYKDANEYLTNGAEKEFTKAWWSAKRYLPEGVISSFSEYDAIIDSDEKKDAIPYPFGKLQELTYGIRSGEVNLVTAMEGIGKTEIFRALEYNILKTTDANIGVIHLEEGKSRIVKGIAGYELQLPVHLPDSNVSKDDIKRAFREAVGRDERVHIYTHFGSDDPDVILNTIRFMAGACGCKYIFLDHITLVVTGLQSEDERKTLDYISTKLAMMVEELGFTLFVISHVNDEGQTRGSRNISKIADLHLHLDRDVTAATEAERMRTHLTVKKNRFAGKTGSAGTLVFSPETFTISEELELPA
jgi:twinkle protein